MADIFEYYKVYQELKAHFNSKKFIFTGDSLPLATRWNKESEKRKAFFVHFRDTYPLNSFIHFVISTLSYNPFTYFMHLETEQNFALYNQYKIWWGNTSYYFKSELQYLDERYETIDLKELVNDLEIRVETEMLLRYGFWKYSFLSMDDEKLWLLMSDRLNIDSFLQSFELQDLAKKILDKIIKE